MSTRRRFVLSAVAAHLALTTAPAHAQVTTLVSKSSQGQIANAPSDRVDVSGDGRWIVFDSVASNLVPGDTNNWKDVFLHDALTGTTSRVSVGFGGAQPDQDCYWPTISADGRYIAFVSGATNLLPVSAPGFLKAFVVERESGAIERIDVNDAGEGADGPCLGPVAMDLRGGRFAFASTATNLAPTTGAFVHELFVRDRFAGTTTLVSVDPSGAASGENFGAIDMSWDGGTIVCATEADNLGPADTSPFVDVYAYDLHNGTWSLVGVSSAGAQGNHGSVTPSVSADGRLVAFVSQSTNLHPQDTEFSPDIFVRDLATGTTQVVSYGADGMTGHGNSWDPTHSADGRFVYFRSTGALSPVYSTGGGFRRDLLTGALEAVSLGHELQMGPVDQRMATTSDGAIVVFASWTQGLTPEDTSLFQDVFYRAASGCPPGTLLYPDADGDGFGVVAAPILSCTLLAGFAANSSDCDDSDPLIHPGAAETCNGADENCDDIADDGCVVVYCTAKTNSLGCVPAIGASQGYASAAGPDHFFVLADEILSSQFGVFIWSQAGNLIPFGGGVLCLGAPVIRAGALNSGGSPPGVDCSGTFSFHFSQHVMALGQLEAGDTVFCQFWSRDPGFAAPQNISLTDALKFQIGP